jgi:ApaG protein
MPLAMPRSEATTRGVRVAVESRYLPEQSAPERKAWLFAYQVTIANEGEHTVQLLTRHWVITDADGKVEEVRGPGVVGHQPILRPGESFSYTSGCPLRTEYGTMHGSYQLLSDDGEAFDAVIAPFGLSLPFAVN